MAGAPKWKVYRADGVYMASCKEPEAAAALASLYSDGAKVKHDHRLVVWTEGEEEVRAGESYDRAAEIMLQRLEREISRWGMTR